MDVDTRTTSDTDAFVLVADFAATLAAGGRAALPTALDELVLVLGLRSAVLRDPVHDGDLRAVAGDVVHAVPRARLLEPVPAPEAVVELPVRVAGRLVRTLTVVGARPSQLPALRACAAVVGLALCDRPPATPVLALAVLQTDDDDAEQIANALHDGPVQDLVAARYATDVALRGGELMPARDAVQIALVALRQTLWFLRPRGAAGLAPALAALSRHLEETGRPGLELRLDETACAALAPAVASAGYRLVQAVVPPAGAAPAVVAVGWDGARVVLEIDGGTRLPAAERWSARARTVAADLHLSAPPGTALVLTVPVPARPEQKATP